MILDVAQEMAPEIRPLAWLVGSWHGRGVISYPTIPHTTFWQEAVFDHDGGPYLRCVTTLYATPDILQVDPKDPPVIGPDEPRHAVWATESSYWRVSPQSGPTTELEILVTDPAGHLSLFLGEVAPGRVTAASDLIARTTTALPITAAQRMYGLVDGGIFWAWDLAAFGQELQSYASGRLTRLPQDSASVKESSK